MRPLASSAQRLIKCYYDWSSKRAIRKQRKACIKDKRSERRKQKQYWRKNIMKEYF